MFAIGWVTGNETFYLIGAMWGGFWVCLCVAGLILSIVVLSLLGDSKDVGELFLGPRRSPLVTTLSSASPPRHRNRPGSR